MVDSGKEHEVFRAACELFETNCDWTVFFRDVLGNEGCVARAFPTAEAVDAFKRTEQYAAIQQMLAKLRAKSGNGPSAKESNRVITVRLPQSMHEALMREAELRGTSMNKLCISKLLQVVDDELIPKDRTEARRAEPTHSEPHFAATAAG